MVDSIKRDLANNKDSIKKNLINIQKILGHLYQLNTKKVNNKLIFIKKGLDKVNLAQRYISSLKLNFTLDNKEDGSDINNALKEVQSSIIKLENILLSKNNEQKRYGTSSQDILSYKKDMDILVLAKNCLRTLDTDLGLNEKDFDRNELKDLRGR